MNKIVVPGEEVPLEVRDNVIKRNDKNYSDVVGVLSENSKIIPLSGPYRPQRDDVVIGIITDQKGSGYVVDTNAPYDSYLSSRREYRTLDVIIAKVNYVNEVNSISLSFEKRLIGGEIIYISPMKIARIIGKKNSMLNMLREMTKTDIQIGKNGIIWIKGEKTDLAKQVIKFIEDNAHRSGLTDEVKKMLEKEGEGLNVEG